MLTPYTLSLLITFKIYLIGNKYPSLFELQYMQLMQHLKRSKFDFVCVQTGLPLIRNIVTLEDTAKWKVIKTPFNIYYNNGTSCHIVDVGRSHVLVTTF